MGYKHCSEMRRLLGIPEDAYDHLKEDLYKDKAPLNPSQQALVDVVKAHEEATLEVYRIHNTSLIKNEVISVEPMKAPEGALFFLSSMPDRFAEEDAICRDCKKVLVLKDEKTNGVEMHTIYLGHARGGGVEYVCYDCKPKTKPRRPRKGSMAWRRAGGSDD
jgi:hypothetical protein